MVSKTLVFTGTNGLHARPAGALVKKSKEFKDSNPKLIFGENEVNATSLVKVLSLGVKNGSELTVTAEGDNAQEAVDAIVELLSNIVD